MFGSPRIKTVLTCSDTQLRLDLLVFSFFEIHSHPELVRPGRHSSRARPVSSAPPIHYDSHPMPSTENLLRKKLKCTFPRSLEPTESTPRSTDRCVEAPDLPTHSTTTKLTSRLGQKSRGGDSSGRAWGRCGSTYSFLIPAACTHRDRWEMRVGSILGAT